MRSNLGVAIMALGSGLLRVSLKVPLVSNVLFKLLMVASPCRILR